MDERAHPITRGAFLRRSAGFLGVIAFGPSRSARSHCDPSPLDHPDPRPDITAEKVLANDALGSKRSQKVIDGYEAARTYPSIFDGLACGCGCTGKNGSHRSLLVCFETLQPTGCAGCIQEAQLVARLAKDETALAEIRAAVDRKFG